MSEDKFEGWAIVELMGHRRLAGFVTEQEIAGHPFLRLDVAGPPVDTDGPEDPIGRGTTQFYSPQAVYCITPTTQDIAVAIGRRSHPAPVQRYELEPRRADHDGDDIYDDPEPF